MGKQLNVFRKIVNNLLQIVNNFIQVFILLRKHGYVYSQMLLTMTMNKYLAICSS